MSYAITFYIACGWPNGRFTHFTICTKMILSNFQTCAARSSRDNHPWSLELWSTIVEVSYAITFYIACGWPNRWFTRFTIGPNMILSNFHNSAVGSSRDIPPWSIVQYSTIVEVSLWPNFFHSVRVAKRSIHTLHNWSQDDHFKFSDPCCQIFTR